jgi:hypothetical protein
LDTKSANSTKVQPGLNLGQAALKGEENEVGATSHAKLVEKIRNMKLYGALGDVELAGDFLVGEILEKRIQNFLLAAAQVGDGIRFQATALSREDGIDKTGEKLARNPKASTGDERKSADELVARFDVSEKAFHAEAEKRKTICFVVLFADYDKAGFGVALENIGQERAGSRLGSVRINDIYLRLRRLEVTQIGSKRGFELLGDNFEGSFPKNALELAQHKWVRREDANRQLGGCPFRSHYPQG